MILMKAYGKSTLTAAVSILVALSMIINEGLVARTFGPYTLQLFDLTNKDLWVSLLGVAFLILAYIINVSGNKVIGKTSQLLAVI